LKKGGEMAVDVDLFGDFVEQMRTNNNMDASIDQLEVVKRYVWYNQRRLPQRNWKVHYSKELKQNSFFIKNTQYIDHIRDMAECGDDLTPHMSELVMNIEERDELLADWGIYHLHPGHGKKPAKTIGFVNRAKELLFVFPSNGNLYFLDVLGHTWTNLHLIQVIDNNWPEVISKYKFEAIKLAIEQPTEDQLYKLRKNQVNVPFRVGNSFYIGPGGGLAINGAASQAVNKALDFKNHLNKYSQQFKKDETDLRKILGEKVGAKITLDPLCLKLKRYDPKEETIEVLETNFGIEFTFKFPKLL
jgi:hypothetical protein